MSRPRATHCTASLDGVLTYPSSGLLLDLRIGDHTTTCLSRRFVRGTHGIRGTHHTRPCTSSGSTPALLDGDSVALTAATQPSIEEIALGALPGLPKVAVHWPLIDFESGPDKGADTFIEYYFRAERASSTARSCS